MTHIIATLFPVFVIIGLGFLLAKRQFLSRLFINELNRFVYWVCLPSLIMHTLANAGNLPAGTTSIWFIFIAASTGVLGLSFVFARLLGLKRWQYGTFMQSSFRGNLAFIGIPVLVYAMRDHDREVVASVVAQAIFVFVPTMVYYNVMSVVVLVASQESDLRRNLSRAIRSIVTNPLILAALTGILLYALPFNLPVPANNALEFVGRMAGPAALICVGGGMAFVSMEGRYRSASFASALKVFAVPLFAYFLTLPFDFSGSTVLILMVFSATPTAVASYVMAKEMHGDEAMASGGIVLSTLFSILSLGIVVGLF